MELKTTLKLRKFINNTKPELPGFSDGTYPLNFTNPYWRNQANAEWDNEYSANTYLNLARDINPVSISKMSGGILNDRQLQLKEVPLKTPRKSALQNTENKSSIDVMPILSSGIEAAKTISDSFAYNKTANDMQNEAGYGELLYGGIGYRTAKTYDASRERSEVNKEATANTVNAALKGATFGASVGSVLPGLGTVIGGAIGGIVGGIGGLFGGKSKKKKMEELLRKQEIARIDFNSYNRSGAASDYLAQKEAEELSQPRYKDGKQPLLDTSFGIIKGLPNAKVDKGEWMINTITGDAHKVQRGAGDNALAYVRPEDAILSKKRGAADYFEQTGDLIGALSLNKNKYSNGKIPTFKEGWLPSTIIGGLGMLTGLNQYFDARRLNIKNPNTYASNPYTNMVQQGLAGLQYNPYPILNKLTNLRSQYDYAINNSGGLGGSQKYLGKIANANNMYAQTANMLSALLERNIGLRSNYFTTMANIGNQEAQRRQSANQWDLDYYSKAHAARQAGMQMGIYNMLNQMQNWYANDFKRRQFNDTMKLYRDDLKLDWYKLKNKIA